MQNDDDFKWIINWYYTYCNGEWEHENSIQIGTLDNPGWYLKVCLQKPDLQHKLLQPVDIERSEDDWIYCSVKDGLFQGFGGPFNLPEILHIFRKWASNVDLSS